MAEKKTAAKSAEKKTEPEAKPAADDKRVVYLPTLPEGYSYAEVTIAGPDGTATSVKRRGDHAVLVLENGDEHEYPSMNAAVRRAAKVARALIEVERRRAEVDKILDEAFKS